MVAYGSELVVELRTQHQTILDRLAQVELDQSSSPTRVARLQAIERMIMDHLKLEDEQIYPALRRAADDDVLLRGVLDAFARDSEELSTRIARFFERARVSDPSGLERECSELIGTLRVRVRREEELLFSEYEKLPAGR